MKLDLLVWRYYFILFPVHVLTVLFTIAPQPLQSNTLPKWLLVTIVSYVIMAIPFALFRHFKASVTTPLKQGFALAFVGMVRGFAILDLSLILNLPTIKPYILRPLNSAVSVTLWFLIAHFIFGSRAKFKSDFHEMYTRSLHAQLSSMKKVKSADVASAEVLTEKINKALDPLRRQFETYSGKKLSPKEIAEEALIIRSFIDQQIRPLSHELWRSKKFKPPRLAFFKIVVHSLFRERLPLTIVLIPVVIFGLTGLTTVYGLSEALLIGSPSWIALVIVTAFYRFGVERLTISKAAINSTAFFCIFVITPFFQWFVSTLLEIGRFVPTSTIIGNLFYFILLLAFSVHNSLEKFYDSIRNIMKGQITIAQSQSRGLQDSELTQDYAAYLHGDVQAQLLSASMQMDRAASEMDVKLGNKAMKRASNVLRRDHQSYVVGAAIDSRSKLHKLVESWSGIAVVQMNIEKKVKISEIGFLTIYRVLEDVISNSVRHGSASEIHISIDKAEDDILIEFQDNGQPLKRGKKGLGSEILEKEALSFKYSRVGDKNKLEIKLPD